MSRLILVIKTRKGYALVPYIGEIPSIDFSTIEVYSDLQDSFGYSYAGTGGVFGALKAHFEAPEPAKDSE